MNASDTRPAAHHAGPRRTGRADSRQGQSLVEMAVVVPVLLFMVLGSLDLGRIYFANIAITNAAREGAHMAALDYDDYSSSTALAGDIHSQVIAETAGSLELGTSNANITTTVNTDSGVPFTETSQITVTVTYSFTLLFLNTVSELIAGWWGGPTLQQTNPISYTSSFPVIIGELVSSCSGGTLLASPSEILESEFNTTTVTLNYSRTTSSNTRFDSSAINVYWNTKDGSTPGQTLFTNRTSASDSFNGTSVTTGSRVAGSHYVYAIQPSTNKCAAAIVILTCSKTAFNLGSFIVPANSGVYFNFTSNNSPGSVDGNGTFPATGATTRVEVYDAASGFSNVFGVNSGIEYINAATRSSRSSLLLSSNSDTAAGARTASYNVPGTAFGGGNFTVLYFNENPFDITVSDSSAAGCSLTYSGAPGTPTPTATVTNTPLPSATPTNTNTPGPTATPTNTPLPASTNTPGPTPTPTDTPVPTSTQTPTSTPLATSTSTATPTNTPIPAPSNLALADRNGVNITLSWTGIGGATAYRVYSCQSNGSANCAPSAQLATTVATTYGPFGLTGSSGDNNCFEVTAIVGGVESGRSGRLCVLK